jgi:hypothetical protein
MVGDLERRVNEIRYLDGVEKVEHVPYRTGDEFWVRFNRPLDLNKVNEAAKKYSYQMVRFASLPSKLPRGLAEILWDGVAYVIVRKITALAKLQCSLGFEPQGIAKIAYDLHGPYQIFMANDEDGMKVLYEYLGLRYVPPTPPPKIAAPAKPSTPAATRPTSPAPRPPTPTGPGSAEPPTAAKPSTGQPTTPSAPKPPEAPASNRSPVVLQASQNVSSQLQPSPSASQAKPAESAQQQSSQSKVPTKPSEPGQKKETKDEAAQSTS